MAGLTLNNYQQLDPAGAIETGQRMAMNQMQIQDQNQQRTIRNQAVAAPGGYSPQAHMDMLMHAGFFEEAQDMQDIMDKKVANHQEAMVRGLNIMEKTGELVTKVGAPAWPMFRGSLIAAGLADENSLPAQYDDQAAQIAQNFTQNSSDVFRMLRVRNGDMQQDITNIGGKITYGKPYKPGTATALEKNTKFLADITGMSEDEAVQFMLTAKDKSDSAIYKDLYTTALRTSMGDEEEAARIAKSGLDAVRKVRNQQRASGGGGQPSPKPGGRPYGGQSVQKFEEGRIYTDANGNKARYVKGNWEPVR